MGAARFTAVAAIAALALSACGGGSSGDNGQSRKTAATSGSSLRCLELSTLSPERYKGPDDSDLKPTVRRLMTGSTGAVAILTGTEFGADVIEYRTAPQAMQALTKAQSYELGAKKVTASARTLFIDYAGDAHIRKVVEACSRTPGKRPPP